jgi:hypothetical protein
MSVFLILFCRYEELSGVKSAAVRSCMRASDAALDALTADQRSAVAAARPTFEDVLTKVAAAVTDELGAYQQGSLITKVQRWDNEGAALIGPLL